MASISEVENGNYKGIVTLIIIGGLGFYLAINLSETVDKTIDRFLPQPDDELTKAWINLIIAIVLVIVLVLILLRLYAQEST